MASIDLAVAAALADGRFPSGGHAHSAGFEAATALADMTDPDTFDAFMRGRIDRRRSVSSSLFVARSTAFSTYSSSEPATSCGKPAFVKWL